MSRPASVAPRVPQVVILVALLVVLGCAAAPPMPRSLPMRGQSPETMGRDRADCEEVARTDPTITALTTKGGGQPAYWMLGGPKSVAGQQLTRQRHASFGACMESRGYAIDPAR
jgi:hypothetical protein